MALPLEGIRILEVGQIIAGCFGTIPLADLGAGVIKVEPHKGDAGRMPSEVTLGENWYRTANRG